jgi:hypothetical protein
METRVLQGIFIGRMAMHGGRPIDLTATCRATDAQPYVRRRRTQRGGGLIDLDLVDSGMGFFVGGSWA